MGLKSFLKNYIIATYLFILIGCIVYLYWQNLVLKKEISIIKSQIGHIEYFDPPQNTEIKSASGLYYFYADLDRPIKYLKRDVDILLDTL